MFHVQWTCFTVLSGLPRFIRATTHPGYNVTSVTHPGYKVTSVTLIVKSKFMLIGSTLKSIESIIISADGSKLERVHSVLASSLYLYLNLHLC